jgi:hypothetical protein
MLDEQWRKSTRSHTNGCIEARWVKATASNSVGCVEVAFRKATASMNGNCVEVATDPACGQVQVRDTKDGRLLRRLARLLRLRRRTVLTFTATEWASLLMDVAAGHFHWSRFAPLQFDRAERAAFEAGVVAEEFELPAEAASA